MLFLLSLSLMRTAGAPAHTSNLYVSKAADSYSFNEENRSDNNFTTKHHAGLCQNHTIDDLITEKRERKYFIFTEALEENGILTQK